MIGPGKAIFKFVTTFDAESSKVIDYISRCHVGTTNSCKVLDVGCGVGRYLGRLSGERFDVMGVDANADIVGANRKAGLHCLTVEEFARTHDEYDIILMSHVIEHFSPPDLLHFMDGYLDRLKVGGSLIIATPLLTPYFYDDFDHVKPYHPRGILMVFGTDNAQVQYYSRNKLILDDLWIRRSPVSLPHTRGAYILSLGARLRQAGLFLNAVMFRLSGGFIGEDSGWVGLFKKVN